MPQPRRSPYSGSDPGEQSEQVAWRSRATVSGHIQLGQSILTAMWRLAYPPRLAPVGSAEGRLQIAVRGRLRVVAVVSLPGARRANHREAGRPDVAFDQQLAELPELVEHGSCRAPDASSTSSTKRANGSASTTSFSGGRVDDDVVGEPPASSDHRFGRRQREELGRPSRPRLVGEQGRRFGPYARARDQRLGRAATRSISTLTTPPSLGLDPEHGAERGPAQVRLDQDHVLSGRASDDARLTAVVLFPPRRRGR